MVEQFANSGDPDQTPLSAASDFGLHCLSVTCLGVSSLQLVKNLFLQNHWIDCLESTYVASATLELQTLYKWWHWVDLDVFYGGIKFDPYDFERDKLKYM